MVVTVKSFIPKPGNYAGTPYGGGSYVLSDGRTLSQEDLEKAGGITSMSKGGGISYGPIDESKLPGATPAPAATSPSPTSALSPPAPAVNPLIPSASDLNKPTSGFTRPVAPTPEQTASIKEDANIQAAGQAAVAALQDQSSRSKTIISSPEQLTSVFDEEDALTKKANIGYKKLLGD